MNTQDLATRSRLQATHLRSTHLTLKIPFTVGAVFSLTFVQPSLATTPIANVRAALPSPSPVQLETDDYLLGPGDRVKIDIFDVPEFSGEYQVLPSGAVNLPLIGAVRVQGRTLQQASAAIAAQYGTVLQRPSTTVSLLASRPIQIAIAGEVNRPGSYVLVPQQTANTPENSVATLSRTIQLAEGITQAADLRRVQIRRPRSVESGASEVITVDLWELLQTGNVQQDLRLRDGDSIFIPTATAINLNDARQLAAANIAPRNNRPIKITVVGEVNRPGPYSLIEGAVGQRDQLINPNLLQVPSVTRAIQVAGGITELADVRNIQVRRLTRSGETQVINLDFWKLLKAGDPLQDLPLQDGDTVEIPTAKTLTPGEITELAKASFSPDKITVSVVGEVEAPGTISVPPNTPLNQAILTAGGFNDKAKKDITLIRLNPNGTVTKRDISIDLSQPIASDSNPALRNNDIVVVKKTGFATFVDSASRFMAPFNGFLNIFRFFGF